MRFKFVGAFLALSLSVGLVGCLGSGSSASSNPNKPTPTVTSITVNPANSAVTMGKTLQFSAQATYSDGSSKDISSTANWATSDSSVATISSSGLVTGVKIGLVNVTVGSGSAKASVVLSVTAKAFSQASLSGDYALTLTAETSQARFEAGSIKADGAGNFSGIEDINATTGVAQGVTVTGTYTVLADGRGSLTLNTAGLPSRTFHFALSANSAASGDNNAQLIQFDKAGTAVGTLVKQDSSVFQNSSLAGHAYVFRVGGLDSTQHPVSTIGEFSVDASGTSIASGEEDENDNGNINSGAGSSSAVSITAGTIGTVDSSTGRVSLTLTAGGQASNFVAYIISASQMGLIGVQTAPMVMGQAEMQSAPAPSAASAGGYMLLTQIGAMAGQYWIMGQLQLDATGKVTGVAQAQDGALALNPANPAGSMTVSAGGRGTLQENTSQGTRDFIVYLVSGAKSYLLQTNDAHADSGVAELQQPGADGFTTGTLNNSFVFSAGDTSDGNIAMVGEVVADGAGNFRGMIDVSQPQSGNPSQLSVATFPFVGSYSAPQGAGISGGVLNTPGAGLQTYFVFMVSGSKTLILGISPTDVNGVLQLQ